jgi:hypothetical protein
VFIGQVHLTTVVRKLATYNLDLVGVQEVRWTKKALQEQRILLFCMKRNEKHQFGTGFFVLQ